MMATLPDLKVFVVEDEALITMTIEDVIETLGFQIVGPVAQLDEALTVARTGDFDCAVLDINIRGGNTYAIADLLLERGCPFLIATGCSDWSMPEHLVPEKRLTKPFSSTELETELCLLAARVQSKKPHHAASSTDP